MNFDLYYFLCACGSRRVSLRTRILDLTFTTTIVCLSALLPTKHSSSITCPPNRFMCLWTHLCTGLPQPLIGATRSILLDMANNTPLEEFASLKHVKPMENAQVQGIVMSVSPMKKGQVATYFDAKVADEEKEIRIVGFSSNLRRRMATLENKQEPVTLENCRIKKQGSQTI